MRLALRVLKESRASLERHDVNDHTDNSQADHPTDGSGDRRRHQWLGVLETMGKLTVDVAAGHPAGRASQNHLDRQGTHRVIFTQAGQAVAGATVQKVGPSRTNTRHPSPPPVPTSILKNVCVVECARMPTP